MPEFQERGLRLVDRSGRGFIVDDFGNHHLSAASNVLGISFRDAEYLFSPDCEPPRDLRGMPWSPEPTASAGVVAHHIRNYVAARRPKWEHDDAARDGAK